MKRSSPSVQIIIYKRMNISLTCKYFLLHFPTQIKLFPLDILARSTPSWTSTVLASCTSRTMCVCSPSVMTSSTGGLTRLCSTPAACEFYRQKRFLLTIDLFQRQVYWQARAADHWDGESCPHAGGGGCRGLRGRWVEIKDQSTRRLFQQGEGPSRGLLWPLWKPSFPALWHNVMSGVCARYQRSVWDLMEKPESSRAAKVRSW